MGVPLLLAVASIVSAWVLNLLLSTLEITVPWYIDAPSVVGFYSCFHVAFDRWAWRAPLLRRFGLLNIPDLRGSWAGEIASCFDNYRTKRDATIRIRQTWTAIAVSLSTQNSTSYSRIGAILTESKVAPVLSYEYVNEPKATAKETMHSHRGTAWPTLQSDNQTLSGEYYTGRDRQNFGICKFERVQNKCG